MIKKLLITTALVLPLAYAGVATAQTAKKPNIIMIMADDVGIWNISAYHRGMMGGSTPNIDRIATEGALFTDYYAQQSCTAGRAAFILGQTPFRTGLLTVGLPAAKEGVQDKDPTIAELLKPLAMQRRRSARTISVTATSSFLQCTASTSSMAFSTTSTPWKNPMNLTTRRPRTSVPISVRATS
jgi:sulfatase-like protein